MSMKKQSTPSNVMSENILPQPQLIGNGQQGGNFASRMSQPSGARLPGPLPSDERPQALPWPQAPPRQINSNPFEESNTNPFEEKEMPYNPFEESED